MFRISLVGAVMLSLMAISSVHATTSLLDNNYFAFHPTRAFAIKQSGGWVIPDFSLTMGLERMSQKRPSASLGPYQFFLNLKEAQGVVPSSCQKKFVKRFDDNPEKSTKITGGREAQAERFSDKGCSVTLRIAGMYAYPYKRFESTNIQPPQGKSVSFGELEVQTKDGVSKLEFAIPVEDISLSSSVGTEPETEVKSNLNYNKINSLLGEWVNSDPNTRSYTRLIISTEGNMISIHFYGACHPKDCDAGEAKCPVAEANRGSFTLTQKLSFKNEKYDVQLFDDGTLSIKSYVVFTDNSGRKPYNRINIFKKTEVVAVKKAKKAKKSKATANETGRDGRFIAYDNGTVLDTRTNLMWASKDNGSDINWADAKSYCENYRGGGYTDWRMPAKNELAGLYDAGKSLTAACTSKSITIHVATKLIDITGLFLWAAETRGSDATRFYFHVGAPYWFPQSSTGCYRALPVRSGK